MRGLSQYKVESVVLKTYRFLAGILVLSLATSAAATDLADAYQDAQNNDPVLGAAKAGLAATQQIAPQSRSALLPNIRVGGSSAWNERSFPDSPLIPDQGFNEHS